MRRIKQYFIYLDQKVDGAISYFFKHYGKTKFMMQMSKKAQSWGLEALFLKSPKAFIYFFCFYLIRDSIIYILIPIFIATCSDKRTTKPILKSTQYERKISK